MEFSKEDLTEAKRQIDSTLHKLRETLQTLHRKEQPERRIKAFEIAARLIEQELTQA